MNSEKQKQQISNTNDEADWKQWLKSNVTDFEYNMLTGEDKEGFEKVDQGLVFSPVFYR